MNSFLIMILAVAGFGMALILVIALCRKSRNRLANIAEGQRLDGRYPKLSDGALASRFLLVKAGSDSDHVVVSTAADEPYGVCTDEAVLAEEVVSIRLLNGSSGTAKVQNDATGAIAFGDVLVPAAGGQVKKIAAGAGNYFVVGKALNAAAAQADIIEIAPIGAWKTQ